MSRKTTSLRASGRQTAGSRSHEVRDIKKVVTPAARKKVASYMMDTHKLSERRAWQLSGVICTVVCYELVAPKNGRSWPLFWTCPPTSHGGWAMSVRIKTELVLSVQVMAYWRRRPKHKVIVHSDQGFQYTSYDWPKMLDQNGLIASMSRKGNCYDYSVAESFISY